MSPLPINASAEGYFLALEFQEREKARRQRTDLVAKVLREQRMLRGIRAVLTATIGASALTGLATLLMMS